MALHAHPDPREPRRPPPGVLQADQAVESGELPGHHGAEEQHRGRDGLAGGRDEQRSHARRYAVRVGRRGGDGGAEGVGG